MSPTSSMIFLGVLAHNSINQGLNIHSGITAHGERCLSTAGCHHDLSMIALRDIGLTRIRWCDIRKVASRWQ